MAIHKTFDGRLHIYKRSNSRYWQCSTFLNGKKHRTSTKEESLEAAKDFAEDWYLGLRGKIKMGQPISEKTFAEAAERFLAEYTVITGGDRSERYMENIQRQLKLYLLPFFGEKGLSQVTAGLVQDYRVHRQSYQVTHPLRGEKGGSKPPARTSPPLTAPPDQPDPPDQTHSKS